MRTLREVPMDEEDDFKTRVRDDNVAADNGFPNLDEDQTQQDHYESSNDSVSSSEIPSEVDGVVREDMSKLENIFHDMGFKFRMIDRIGEGTFSTVYKAEDMHYKYYQNDWDLEHQKGLRLTHGRSNGSERRRLKPRYVAIKKIYVTSSPMRIQNELELLHVLKGYDSICPLITAFRHQDQVVAILPHFRHQDFRMFYRQLTPYHIKIYFRSLFSALAAVHRHGIIHRDIKPTNFLYDIERKRGVLVDFGLAEREGTDSSHCICQDIPALQKQKIKTSRTWGQPAPTGYPKNDQRASRRANRAGTRGFRAPEVLLKCTSQTSKIDIWSAGVILLTILAQRFPFFNSADDIEAMIEIASIFGLRRMRSCAQLHGAVFDCNIPTIGEKGYSLEQIVQWSISSTRPDEGEDLDLETKECVGFLERCLELDPKKRISARAALVSDFLSDQVDAESEIDELQMID